MGIKYLSKTERIDADSYKEIERRKNVNLVFDVYWVPTHMPFLTYKK